MRVVDIEYDSIVVKFEWNEVVCESPEKFSVRFYAGVGLMDFGLILMLNGLFGSNNAAGLLGIIFIFLGLIAAVGFSSDDYVSPTVIREKVLGGKTIVTVMRDIGKVRENRLELPGRIIEVIPLGNNVYRFVLDVENTIAVGC